jgi:uncharacterized protein
MPTLKASYKAPWFFSNSYLQTMYAGAFRPIRVPAYERERLELPDGDFVDIDWLKQKSERLVILTHGMCGSSRSKSVIGLAHAFYQIGYDVVALNFRGASGENNRHFRIYHSGETGDLRTLIQLIAARNSYQSISLAGYSLGGNVILKYLGEEGKQINPIIKRAAVMSVPCDLYESNFEIEKWKNKPYLIDFNRDLRKLLYPKAVHFPDLLTKEEVKKAKNFVDFANLYVTRAFGFKDADDYHKQASSLPHLQHIAVPTLLLQAKDDTLISQNSIPYEVAEQHPFLRLEVSEKGGHVGFVRFSKDRLSWAEMRLRAFIDGRI